MILVDANDCLPPHGISHPDKYLELTESFRVNGWGRGYPTLIGYPWSSSIQLLSGSHRWAAALATNTPIPLTLKTYEEVWSAWGTDQWFTLMKSYEIL